MCSYQGLGPAVLVEPKLTVKLVGVLDVQNLQDWITDRINGDEKRRRKF